MNELNPCECGGIPVIENGYSKSASTKKYPINAAFIACGECGNRTGDMLYNPDNAVDEAITLKAIADVWNAGAYR